MASPAEVSAAKQDSMNEGLSEYYYTPFSADIDECMSNDNGCNGTCINTDGIYRCTNGCQKGYYLHEDRRIMTRVCKGMQSETCD